MIQLPATDALPEDLRSLVKWSVAMLGRTVERHGGRKLFEVIEELRKSMADLRDEDDSTTTKVLTSALERMRKLQEVEREQVARAYALMLELMNACENAHRSHRLASRLYVGRPGG